MLFARASLRRARQAAPLPFPSLLPAPPLPSRCFSSVDDGPRTFTLLTPELSEAASVCIADSFAAQADPFTFSLNLKRHHWFSLVIPFVERAANAKVPLSVVSVDKATGRVDGVMANEGAWRRARVRRALCGRHDFRSAMRAARLRHSRVFPCAHSRARH